MHKKFRMNIKSIIKSNIYLLDFIAAIYSLGFIVCHLSLILKGKLIVKGAFMRRSSVHIQGINARITIGRRSRVKRCNFYSTGTNTSLSIGGGKTIISNTDFHVADKDSCIVIGSDFTMEGGHIASTEGRMIMIGDDCMFSNHIEIRNGDSHAIFKDGMRINEAQDIVICDHVWLCANAKIMKGVFIAENSIVGNSSLVSGICDENNSIYAGIPAKKIKTSIQWSRKR